MTQCLDTRNMLALTVSEQFDPGCINLLDRWLPVADWMAARLRSGEDASCKSNASRIGPRVAGRDGAGRGLSGINMASQDFLSLASHPRVVAAASVAGRRFGVHSAGTAAEMGLSPLSKALEERLADFLRLEEVVLMPSGWAAGYGAIRALMREGDHVLIDAEAHDCLQEGAAASGAMVHRMPHGAVQAVADRLERLRDQEPQAGVLIVTESFFTLSGDTPDLRALQALARRHAATLLVDAAHDLGAMGLTGGGAFETQGMLGRVDVVTGSFSKVFAANGGFVASNHPALRQALRFGCGLYGQSNAISPVQAAVVLTALEIVRDAEGQERRDRLMRNALRLGAGLQAEGLAVEGQPGPVVPVRLGPVARARRLTAEVLAQGALVNLDEEEAGLRAIGRWRLRLMADHGPAEIDDFLAALRSARRHLAEEDAAQDEMQAGMA